MITKYTLIFLKIPFQILMFLVSPVYFKKTINHKGKILITNDNVLDSNNFTKGNNRRVVITRDNGNSIEVNKITKDKDYIASASKTAREMQRNSSVKINYKNYPNSLDKQSVVDRKVYTLNQKTKKRLKYEDAELTDTGDKLTRSDLRKINNMIER